MPDAAQRPLAEGGGVRLLEASRHCDVQVRADRTRLKQVLLNLLSNAVKYNRRKAASTSSASRGRRRRAGVLCRVSATPAPV